MQGIFFGIPAAVLAASLTALPPQEQEKSPASPVSVDAIIIEAAGRTGGQEAIGPETLCKLRVRLRNSGAQKAYGFRFAVKVNGQELNAYDKTVYTQTIDPGTTGEIELHNFYSSEPGGPKPKDGNLTVEITLKEARWVEVKKEGQAGVWTPLGEVKGLPASKSITRPLAAAQK